MSHSLSLSHILTLSLILLSLIKTFVFLVQERLVDSTALNITDQNTLLPRHEKSTKVYTRCTSTVPPSSSVPVSTSQFSEDILSSNDVTLIHVLSDSSSDISIIDLPITL